MKQTLFFVFQSVLKCRPWQAEIKLHRMDGALVNFFDEFLRQLREHINRSHGRNYRIFSSQLSGSLCTLWPMLCGKQSWAWTECSPIFWHSFLICCVQCSRVRQKRTIYRDGTLANFSMRLSSSLGTVRPSRLEKMRSAWTELSPIFSENLLVCFCGSTIHADHKTDCYDFSMKKGSILGHFEVILGSKLASWAYCEPLGSIWDQSGIQGALTSKIPPFGGYRFWTLFGQILSKFRFYSKICKILNANFSVWVQADFWTIFERFWGHFWRSKTV